MADSDKFPSHWMFDYRWGKGKGAGALPNGEKLAWITVGGRTSCFVPTVQKKTGHITPGVKEEAVEDGDADQKPRKGKGKTQDAGKVEHKPKKASMRRERAQGNGEGDTKPQKTKARKPTVRAANVEEEVEPPRKKAKVKEDTQQASTVKPDKAVSTGRRRSTRLSYGV